MQKNTCLSILKTKNVSRLEKLINRAMQVKNDLRNNDLESFKNIVNSTNDTHNKLISSIQKNVDQMIRDRSQQEGVTMAMEEKISKISVLRLGICQINFICQLFDCNDCALF